LCDRIDIGETRERTEHIVEYLRIEDILVDEADTSDELDRYDDSCELESRDDLERTLVDGFFFDLHDAFLLGQVIIIICSSHERDEHDRGRDEDGIENRRTVESRDHDHTDEHDT
jgi:hypothetical protein